MTTKVEERPEIVSEPKQAEPKQERARVTNLASFLAAFVQGTLGRLKSWGGRYLVLGAGTELRYYPQGGDVKTGTYEVLALRLPSGQVLGNASQLKWCGSHTAWGTRCAPWRPEHSWVQADLEKAGARMVPFNVFQEAKLDINKTKVLENGGSETVIINQRVDDYAVPRQDNAVRRGEKVQADAWGNKFVMRPRHYIGGCLMEVDGTCFLFDIDREEALHGIFNPFVVKLPKPATSMAEAYAMLKPEKVVEAERAGLPIERQGEWFFIRRFDKRPKDLSTADPKLVELAQSRNKNDYGSADYHEYEAKRIRARDAIAGMLPEPGELRQNGNQPNRVEMFLRYKDMVLVSGLIEHSGREHRDVRLAGWWEAVPNTATASWQITGQID